MRCDVRQWRANEGGSDAHNGKGQAIMASVFKRGGKGNRGGYWYVSWFDHTGRRQSKSSRTTDKATAERIGAKLETDAARRREGLIDPQLEGFAREARRPIADMIAEYKAKLVANGRSERYITDAVGYIERIAAAEEIVTATDFTSEKMAHFAAGLSDGGKSARTMGAVIGAAKSFTRWLLVCGRLPRDPLAAVKKPNPEGDRRRERRMLLPDEWPHLMAATTAGTDRNGMVGADRALLYRLAIATGLRSNKLRSLNRTSIVLDATRPYVRVKAADTKNGKMAQQFIDRELAEALRSHMTAKTPAARLFALPDPTRMARMLRADLTAARDKWLAEAKRDPAELTRRQQSVFLAAKNNAGECLDFHSLRHTCGAWLSLTGAHPKTVQSVMRHSTITLTMDAYGHMLPGAEAEAADKLGGMVSLSRKLCDDDGNLVRPQLLATGTDGPDRAQRVAQQSGRDLEQQGATTCNGRNLRRLDDDPGRHALHSANTEGNAPLEHAVPRGTMIGLPAAPLAQLAEQLTLNQ
jgi:integrase